MAGCVLGEIDMVKDIFFFSDKCTTKELDKIREKYSQDLKKLRFRTRVSIWKYVKDSAGASGGGEKEKDGEEGALKGPSEETVHENVVS